MPPWKGIPWSVGPSLGYTWPTCCHHFALWDAGLYPYTQDQHLPRDPVAAAMIPDYNLLQSGSCLSWHCTGNTDWTFDCFAFGDIELIWEYGFQSAIEILDLRTETPLRRWRTQYKEWLKPSSNEEGGLSVLLLLRNWDNYLKTSMTLDSHTSEKKNNLSCFLNRINLRELWSVKWCVYH